MVDRFFAVCEAVRRDLVPLFEMKSPFDGLNRELAGARDQLRQILQQVLDPLDSVRVEVEELDAGLVTVHDEIETLLVSCEGLFQLALPSPPRGSDPDAIRVTHMLKVKARLVELSSQLRSSAQNRLQHAEQLLPRVRGELQKEVRGLVTFLAELGQERGARDGGSFLRGM